MDERRRDGGTNYTLRIKEQGMHLTLNEHDDDDDDERYDKASHSWVFKFAKQTNFASSDVVILVS